MKLSNLVQNMKPTAVPRVMKYASQYEDVLYFTMGEPDFNSPSVVKNELKKQIDINNTFYTDEQGDCKLRESIAKKYNFLYGTDFNEENVLIGSGATGGTFLTLMATLNPGDEVILLSPYYSNLIRQIETLGASVSVVELDPDKNFEVSVEKIEETINSKTKMMIINSPNNPLGKALSSNQIEEISTLALKNDLYLISDEVYRTTVYNGKHNSFIEKNLSNFKNTFIIDSFSKSLSMTGYRIGYVVSDNKEAIRNMAEFSDWIYGSVPGFTQQAALQGLKIEDEYSKTMADEYKNRAAYLVEKINEIPLLSASMPDATFYLFMDIRQTGFSSEEYVYNLIDQQKVALIPGNNYGEAGEGFIRISFAKKIEELEVLVERLKKFHKNLKNDLL